MGAVRWLQGFAVALHLRKCMFFLFTIGVFVNGEHLGDCRALRSPCTFAFAPSNYFLRIIFFNYFLRISHKFIEVKSKGGCGVGGRWGNGGICSRVRLGMWWNGRKRGCFQGWWRLCFLRLRWLGRPGGRLLLRWAWR